MAADELVVHTMEVQRALNETLVTLGGAESGLRGFLLTSSEAFLIPHQEAAELLPRQLARLRELVSDNPAQVANVEAFAPLIEQRLAGIDMALAAHRAGQREQAIAALQRSGLPKLNDIRARIESATQQEQALLIERQNSAADLRDRFTSAVVVMLFACGVLAVFALVSVRRYVATVHESRLRLSFLNAELEQRVQARTEELAKAAEEANRERARAESLLTDVNHRVGNNLALVSSFLTMQQRAVKNPDAARALNAARMRVQAIASAHRKLRLGADFATVKVNEVLGAVLEDISAGLPPGDLIRIQCQVEPLEINARDAVSLGVLTSELVMNAVKHAFAPGESGEVSVVLSHGSNSIPVLEVVDDGVGWHDKHSQETGGLGAKIIDMVARQFGGRPERSARFHDGTAASGQRPGTRIRVSLAKLQIMHAT
ncbi:sensor histidine kinase [Steroidobacter sp.]|uniref:sensor histidine kinase n=1 Tax=Steroidobacter sp. TaxID=1978227 RepID=UPI001A3F1469|nr:CHASE3 domain-containing protein [Steroidobacter sp.]MBL8267319.1 CHASE3 domain-containing protein [Steroidobacter sp.]